MRVTEPPGGAHPETIRTPRLELTPMSSEVALAIVNADWAAVHRLIGHPFPSEWRDDGWHWLEPQATKGRHDVRVISWGTRLALPIPPPNFAPDHPHDGAVLAEVGFHGPPDSAGWVEIGYRVTSQYRRQGLAMEATSALLEWAAGHGATGVKASVNPGNTASLGLLRKLGFTAAGSNRHPVLGEQLSFHRAVRTTGRPV